MVQVEISQLTAECNAWRGTLRQYRDEFSRNKTQLQEAARQPLSKEQLQEVEHLQNQFHIQLINIHDLKHAIKSNQRAIEMEMEITNGQIKEDTLAQHENLFAQYQDLDATLTHLRGKFAHFLSSTS